MGKIINVDKVQRTLDRAARNARSGSADTRAGRVLPVVSSMMAGVEYNGKARELDILFVSGKTYRYFDVPRNVYARLLQAESKGQFFNAEIKGAYAYVEVSRRRR
jgi:hypothetical protein